MRYFQMADTSPSHQACTGSIAASYRSQDGRPSRVTLGDLAATTAAGPRWMALSLRTRKIATTGWRGAMRRILVAVTIFAAFATVAVARIFGGYECTVDCSGHKAGYEWAEDKGN